MIFQGSRYARTEVIEATDESGRTRRVLGRRRIPSTPGVVEHVVLEGERLDQLAHRFYDDPLKSWLILDANPEELNPLLLLRPGRRVRIPRNRLTP